MNTRLFTQMMCAILFVALPGIDIWLAFVTPDPRDTISVVMRDWSHRWFILPWAWGVLTGHFWGPKVMDLPAWTPLLLVPIGVAGLAMGALRVWRVGDDAAWWFLIAFGILCGAMLWPIDT